MVLSFSLRTDPDKMKRIARLMKTVSHPSRLPIMELLLEKERLSVNEIAEEIEISQSNASQHLKALEDVEVLSSMREGKQIYYEVENKGISRMLYCVNQCAC